MEEARLEDRVAGFFVGWCEGDSYLLGLNELKSIKVPFLWV